MVVVHKKQRILKIYNSTWMNNTARGGGAIFNSGTLYVYQSFTSNTATGFIENPRMMAAVPYGIMSCRLEESLLTQALLQILHFLRSQDLVAGFG